MPPVNSNNSMLYLSVNDGSASDNSGSRSQLTPSPSRNEIKVCRLFRVISNKLTRRKSIEDLGSSSGNDENNSVRSSSDCSIGSTVDGNSSGGVAEEGGSSSSNRNNGLNTAEDGKTVRHISRSRKNQCRMASSRTLSSSSSDSSDVIDTLRNRHHHSISAESLRKLFGNMNFTGRSQSCMNRKNVKNKKEKKIQKSILRTPTSYTYVRGLSGLPTQRIPIKQIKRYPNCSCKMYCENRYNTNNNINNNNN